MAKRHHFFAVAALLLIPVVTILGPMTAFAINPESAAGHPDYVRNFQLLKSARTAVLLTSALIVCGLWLMCCAFLLKAKVRSYWWLPSALLGPYGLAVLTALKDRVPDSRDLYQRFISRMNKPTRIAYETAVLVAIQITAFLAIMLWSDLWIAVESMRTGVPVAAIIEQRSASSGMWAFGNGLRELYLVALFYLVWPIFFNVAGLFGKSFFPSQQGR
jgi:hypothetical protein